MDVGLNLNMKWGNRQNLVFDEQRISIHIAWTFEHSSIIFGSLEYDLVLQDLVD